MTVVRTYHGSTKDLEVLVEPTAKYFGVARVIGRDDFSVFDAKSHVRDKIPGKGRALTIQAYISDNLMKSAGVPTCITGFQEPNILELKLARILPVSEAHPNQTFYLVDGEWISRLILNEDSSVVKNYKSGKLTLEQIGWPEFPPLDTWLTKPVHNITHKFLRGDPYYDMSNDMAELQKCTGLTKQQINRAWALLDKGNAKINEHAAKLKLKRLDYKNELVVGDDADIDYEIMERELFVADVTGTMDEDRFNIVIDGREYKVSKQFLRDWYEYVENAWFKEFNLAKKSLPFEEWPDAPRLPARVINITSNLYNSFTNYWGEDEYCPGVHSLIEAVHDLAPTLNEINECKKNLIKA